MIEIEARGDVRVVHWRDGENRFNRTSVDTLHGLFEELAGIEGPLGVVLTGEGKFWSNGLDLDWLLAGGDGSPDFLDDVHALFARVLLFPAPVIAAINGHAFAAGAMLASCCDLRVMRADRGYWCLPEADLGLPLTPPMYAVVAQAIPRVTMREATLTGRRYTGPEALAAGIVHELADEADVVDRAVDRAAALALKDKATFARHKELLAGDVPAICGWPR